jgi:hypothetical protein
MYRSALPLPVLTGGHLAPEQVASTTDRDDADSN